MPVAPTSLCFLIGFLTIQLLIGSEIRVKSKRGIGPFFVRERKTKKGPEL